MQYICTHFDFTSNIYDYNQYEHIRGWNLAIWRYKINGQLWVFDTQWNWRGCLECWFALGALSLDDTVVVISVIIEQDYR